MLNDIIQRLATLGYEVTDADEFALKFVIQKTENHIKNSCNILSIPEGLYQIAVDMACGYFLYEKKAIGADSLKGFNLETAIKSIQEGDTNITFAINEGSTTNEQRLDALINYLITYGEKHLVSYRCMTW
jgi:regulator of RNase E activity RraB